MLRSFPPTIPAVSQQHRVVVRLLLLMVVLPSSCAMMMIANGFNVVVGPSSSITSTHRGGIGDNILTQDDPTIIRRSSLHYYHRRRRTTMMRRRNTCIIMNAVVMTDDDSTTDIIMTKTITTTTVPHPTPTILPARESLSSFFFDDDESSRSSSEETTKQLVDFSILSWNILLPNNEDNWWNHKMYSSNVPMIAREWTYRKQLISERLLNSNSDIICIQEASSRTFHDDFDFLLNEGKYDYVLHKKFRFRCVTFFKVDKFTLVSEAHKDRVLVTTLQSNHDSSECLLHIINCHLSGGAMPERRLRQIYDGVDQIRKWKNVSDQKLSKQLKANRPNLKSIEVASKEVKKQQNSGIIVCGDFNSDGNTGVRKFLIDGYVDDKWYEPQYPNLTLTSKVKQHSFKFQDAAELTYGSNVCDGDYGELCSNMILLDSYSSSSSLTSSCRPATYVVPNLASALLKPVVDEEGGSSSSRRTEFGPQLAKGLVETLDLKDWCQNEIDLAFDMIDIDGSGYIEEDEIQSLLERVYLKVYGRDDIEKERRRFFFDEGFQRNECDESTTTGVRRELLLTKSEFIQKLMELQQSNNNNNNNKNNDDDDDGDNDMSTGIVETLSLSSFCEEELERAFETMDLDGNGVIDEYEVDKLLEHVYVNKFGRKDIEEERKNFFTNFWVTTSGSSTTTNHDGGSRSLSKEDVSEVLLALLQEIHGGNEGSELVTIETEADVQRMIQRFTPALKDGLDQVFDQFSNDGTVLSVDDINKFLIKTNGELGRGGTWRNTQAILERKMKESESSQQEMEEDVTTAPLRLTRDDFYSIFAQELGEGKWWQVAYDLEVCGINNIRPSFSSTTKTGGTTTTSTTTTLTTTTQQHYQGWLDYMYFDQTNLICRGFQEALTESELLRVYQDGDALPNEWHPSDHLPIAALFSWSTTRME